VTPSKHLAWIIGATLASAASLTGAQEVARNTATKDAVLEEVVVTVERFQQSLQSYEGTAVTATQVQLDKVGASNLVDLPSLLPGVEISNYEDNTELYVRGIGSNANTELGDPAVAPHLDDVYVPRPRGLGVAFFDIERVEVNVGPQGTIRGRNALGGTINIVSRKPVIGSFEGYAEYGTGNFDHQEVRGALNVPLGSVAAARVAVYSSKHNAYIKNTGPLTTLDGWESQDDQGARVHFLLQPIERLSVLLSADYLHSRGTGSRGVDFFNAALNGINFNDVSDPRQVNQTGFSPSQDTRHWGLALNTTLKTDFLNVQYIGGYRDLHYISDHSTTGRNYDFPGDERQIVINQSSLNPDGPQAQAFVNERYYGAFGALLWDTTSKAYTHELRVTSPTDSAPLTWATGLYYFKEKQNVFLGIPLDYQTALPYLEFNQGDTVGESKSAYADLTWAVTNRLRVTGGARYSEESKSRVGFNFIAGLDTNGVAIRTGTPGFAMQGLDRSLRTTDPDGDGVPNTLNDLVLLYKGGIKSYGINDTLNTFLNGGCVQASQFGNTCAGYPGLKFAFGGATVQSGKNADSYIDWRIRVGFDLTDDNLLYALIATGNKAPSFNDTVDLNPAQPGTQLFTPPIGPEKSTMIEVGSKNTFYPGGKPFVLNASVFYVRYTDQVFSTLIGLQLLDNDPTNDAGCLDADPNTPCAAITLNQNIGKSKNMGLQIDSALALGAGFDLAGTILYQKSEYDNGSVVTDSRRSNPAGGALLVDLGGNELPRVPPLTLNLRLSESIPVSAGTVDWTVAATYKTRQYLTAFNGDSSGSGGRLVTTVDSRGVATGYGASQLRLNDRVDGYAHLDVGVGFTHDASKVRVEGYINNVTDEAHASQAVIAQDSQEFVFNPPRTFGARVKVNF